MKTSELREKTDEELQSLLTEELRSQFNLRMRKGTGQLDKPSEITVFLPVFNLRRYLWGFKYWSGKNGQPH